MPTFTLTAGSAPVPVTVGDSGATFTNAGPSTVYYGDSRVSTASTSLTAGSSVVLAGSPYFTIDRAVNGGVRADVRYDARPAASIAATARDGQPAGIMIPTDRGWVASSTALVSGTRYMMRFAPQETITTTGFRFRVNTASGTDDPVEIVVYDSNRTFIASSGSVSGLLNAGSSTNQTVPMTQLFTGGSIYSVGFVATSTATLLMANYGSASLLSLWSSTPPASPQVSKAAVGIGDTSVLTGYAPAVNGPLLAALF